MYLLVNLMSKLFML